MRPLQDEVEPPVLKLASSIVKLESTQAFSYITEFLELYEVTVAVRWFQFESFLKNVCC